MLDIDGEDKNNNEILECPYLINNKNSNSNHENKNKKYHINLNNDKKIFLLKNPKKTVYNRFDSKEKVRKFFPNLISHNKNS